MLYKKHVFICTNQRPAGGRVCCGEAHGMELVAAFKKQVKARGLQSEIRAQRAGCMETCELGPSVVVYPEGVFYGHVQLSDVDEIVTEHLQNNRVVERLRLTDADFSKLPWKKG
ncbi:(2Fe-2S) ferredoxin domain-containing protein [Pedobacter sp. BS3]|uniref:(2Fe-2S) ferredoxin domain-containing protein n=1 Tax=Pedobacter sp. BS3 TaxID=2567937 RepID=UPI0011ED601A|nr:(2Fe-2S) ferredoxin domain-containing protein [Pedobacter sp. BS3]TZF81861.1 (2Fe-2S) ferredoxin domain-containing protein [Pedobacter sp. BS3]